MTDGNDNDPVDRDIWLADVLNAWRLLGLTSIEDRAAAAEALGFDASALRPAPESATQVVAAMAGSAADGAAAAGDVRAAGSRAELDPRIIPSVALEEELPPVEDLPVWVRNAKPLPPEVAAHATWKPPHVPLLSPHWTRHIMSAIAAATVDEGPIDERRLIEAVSNLRPVVRLPRRPKPTLRRGLHLLVDRSEPLMPFGRDVQDVVTQLRTIVGRDQLVAAAFAASPLRDDVVWLRDRRRGPWQAPPPGTPILVISDLGLSQRFGDTRGAAVSEWLEFAARTRAAGCRVAALVPHGEHVWPIELRKSFSILPWDRRTSVSTVLRFLRASGHRR